MNENPPKWIPRLLIGGMAILALFINAHFLGQTRAGRIVDREAEPVKASETASTKPVQNASAERAQFSARYVNSGFASKNGIRTAAVVAATEDGKLSRPVAAALASRFQHDGQILSSFFKQEFVSDGLFNDAFSGSSDLFRKLDLASSVDVLVLAREGVQYSQNTALDNVITATMRLEIVAVPVTGQGDIKAWTFTSTGPGFTNEAARTAAEERLVKQIADDTKMSLN
jgi:hypothetical protein